MTARPPKGRRHEPLPMVRWYDPRQLAKTAVRVAISTVFGEFADRRELTAITRGIDPKTLDPAYDYGGSHSDIWFDYLADTADGWNPTYALARLMAAPQLKVSGASAELPFADLLVMGGDQVYPTASRDEYAKRLVAPFDAAANGPLEEKEPDLYAIPGNHDWYDGLLAFLGLFARRRLKTDWTPPWPGRVIGGRRTKQTRSYFALRLPHNWWLWGVDVQLTGYIDQPQIDFFAHVARKWMDQGANVILCTGMPSWAYVDADDPAKEFRNFSYLLSLIDYPDRGHRLRLVLTGDSHHYARYIEGDCHYITAGGGGAFLHPTHHLTDKSFDWPYPPPGPPAKKKKKETDRGESGAAGYRREFRIAKDPAKKAESLFPDRDTSRRLTWRNLFFAFYNPEYAATLAAVIGIFTWLISANAQLGGATLSGMWGEGWNPWTALCAYGAAVFASPWPLLLLAVAGLGYCGFADFKGWRRWLAGGLHALAQGAVAVLVAIAVAFWIRNSDFALVVLTAAVGGVLAATVMGLYLLISLNVFGKHWNEAFSALRIEDYKCFLRVHIDGTGKLTVYPIGLNEVPRDDRAAGPADPPLATHLIEPPIEIDAPAGKSRAATKAPAKPKKRTRKSPQR